MRLEKLNVSGRPWLGFVADINRNGIIGEGFPVISVQLLGLRYAGVSLPPLISLSLSSGLPSLPLKHLLMSTLWDASI